MFAAKPASKGVRARPVKAVKDAVVLLTLQVGCRTRSTNRTRSRRRPARPGRVLASWAASGDGPRRGPEPSSAHRSQSRGARPAPAVTCLGADGEERRRQGLNADGDWRRRGALDADGEEHRSQSALSFAFVQAARRSGRPSRAGLPRSFQRARARSCSTFTRAHGGARFQ